MMLRLKNNVRTARKQPKNNITTSKTVKHAKNHLHYKKQCEN